MVDVLQSNNSNWLSQEGHQKKNHSDKPAKKSDYETAIQETQIVSSSAGQVLSHEAPPSYVASVAFTDAASDAVSDESGVAYPAAVYFPNSLQILSDHDPYSVVLMQNQFLNITTLQNKYNKLFHDYKASPMGELQAKCDELDKELKSAYEHQDQLNMDREKLIQEKDIIKQQKEFYLRQITSLNEEVARAKSTNVEFEQTIHDLRTTLNVKTSDHDKLVAQVKEQTDEHKRCMQEMKEVRHMCEEMKQQVDKQQKTMQQEQEELDEFQCDNEKKRKKIESLMVELNQVTLEQEKLLATVSNKCKCKPEMNRLNSIIDKLRKDSNRLVHSNQLLENKAKKLEKQLDQMEHLKEEHSRLKRTTSKDFNSMLVELAKGSPFVARTLQSVHQCKSDHECVKNVQAAYVALVVNHMDLINKQAQEREAFTECNDQLIKYQQETCTCGNNADTSLEQKSIELDTESDTSETTPPGSPRTLKTPGWYAIQLKGLQAQVKLQKEIYTAELVSLRTKLSLKMNLVFRSNNEEEDTKETKLARPLPVYLQTLPPPITTWTFKVKGGGLKETLTDSSVDQAGS